MSGIIGRYNWLVEPDGAVDRLATYVDERGHINYTGPGCHVVIENGKVESRGALGSTRLPNVDAGVIAASGIRRRK